MFKTYEDVAPSETTTSKFGEYGDVINTMKQFIAFLTKLIEEIKAALDKLFNKDNQPE